MDARGPKFARMPIQSVGWIGLLLLTSACAVSPSGREARHCARAMSIDAAIRAGNPSALQRLLTHGADPDLPDCTTGHSPLEMAILAGRPDQVGVLIAAGADLDRTDHVGNTALHIAAQTNQPWIALDLLKAGAGPDIRNAQGRTFRAYLDLMSDDLLSYDARAGKYAVIHWLAQRDSAAGARPRRRPGPPRR